MNDLNLLKLMAKPSYVLACYYYIAEKTIEKWNTDGIMQSYGCHCWEENVDHFCPAHPKYNPNMKCQDHMECSDPIFRCFDLAKLANEYADKVHEFREECNEIARQCRQLVRYVPSVMAMIYLGKCLS